ncbi:hypothetical protein [Streptomyces sp. CB03238]|uniref:hypothetical protein n=1 Tax=Streptomyces sp. CB03238 TaxID=1907777 RepID=UPI000A10AD89|nr:hypothetical protein [Streptomyces sp. CB03238]ORT54028.1 hypothetical protein BKD26_36360 [Streptomyces sp. CB03238]
MTRAVDEEIAGVAWDRLFHAYGTATDTPAHLRGLLTEDEQAISAASEHLWSAILHQGTVWPATAPAAKIVARMLTRPALREGALVFLRQVAVASYLGDQADELRSVAYPADRRPRPRSTPGRLRTSPGTRTTRSTCGRTTTGPATWC